MDLFSCILFQFVHCWCLERLLMFQLILYAATLLKLFMVSSRFWVEFFGSLRYKIMSSANRDILSIYLCICIPFISSTCLIVVARNSRTMLNRSGETGHPCLVPYFRGNGFSFSPLSMMLTIDLVYITCVVP
jgi:hypothetical protein